MPPWSIVDGPRTIEAPREIDADIGWVWVIARGDERRTIFVYVARGLLDSSNLTEDACRAISTEGRSAVANVLDKSDPPEQLVVLSTGTSRT